MASRRSEVEGRAGQFVIGESLAHHAEQHLGKTLAVLRFAVVESEHLLIQVAREMEGIHRNEGALDRPLEQGPEVLQSVGVDGGAARSPSRGQ